MSLLLATRSVEKQLIIVWTTRQRKLSGPYSSVPVFFFFSPKNRSVQSRGLFAARRSQDFYLWDAKQKN